VENKYQINRTNQSMVYLGIMKHDEKCIKKSVEHT